MTTAPHGTPKPTLDEPQTPAAFDCSALYRVEDWSAGHFEVNGAGHISAGPAGLDLHEIIEGLGERGIHPPVLLRFSDILTDRLQAIADAFGVAIAENDFRGTHRAVYPIKVNQQHQIVEEVRTSGAAVGVGLEVGSKPELLAVMAMTTDQPDQLILCNGFKDASYIESVVLAAKLGRTIIPIVESREEAVLIVRYAKKYGVKPTIGVRVKLASQGAGRWSKSAGVKSKFGLFVSETLEMVELLRSEGMLDCLKLLHCHPGSQIEDIQRLKDVVGELTQVYAGLVKTGAPLEYIDIGGGLGVDYRGVQAANQSSMNYTLEEFASDVVYRIGSVLSAAEIPHPTIITECGRAMVAYSSVLVFEIIGSGGPRALSLEERPAGLENPEQPQPIRDLAQAFDAVDQNRFSECYHDAMQARDAAMTLFSLGYLTLEQRATVERLFWSTCTRIHKVIDRMDREEIPEELWTLEEMLSDVYFGNFSVFQSLPDCWAIGQHFPVVPIHRLHEEPTRRAMLVDITCDSDGQITEFIGTDDPETTIMLHELDENPYRVGAFLIGAYQETLGDLHNLFGDAHAVHIRAEDGSWAIEEVVLGDTASDVLGYMQHEPKKYRQLVSKECERATRRGRLTVGEAQVLRRFYDEELEGYTYLEPDDRDKPDGRRP